MKVPTEVTNVRWNYGWLQVVWEADMSAGNYWVLHKNSMHTESSLRPPTCFLNMCFPVPILSHLNEVRLDSYDPSCHTTAALYFQATRKSLRLTSLSTVILIPLTHSLLRTFYFTQWPIPKRCLSTEWKQLMSIKQLITSFRSVTYEPNPPSFSFLFKLSKTIFEVKDAAFPLRLKNPPQVHQLT